MVDSQVRVTESFAMKIIGNKTKTQQTPSPHTPELLKPIVLYPIRNLEKRVAWSRGDLSW